MATVKDEEKDAKNVGPTERDAESYVSRLESVYRHYAPRVYTLCLRLLADEKAAESLTIHVFLQLDARSLGMSDADVRHQLHAARLELRRLIRSTSE